MPIHNFSVAQKLVGIDNAPDHRTEIEKQFTPLSTYNHDKSDISTMERLTEELVNISGAFVRVFMKAENPNSENSVLDDDVDVTYLNPIMIKAYIQPPTSKMELTKWGIDIDLKTTISFSRSILWKETLGRMISIGDVIEVPQNAVHVPIVRYKVLNGFDSGNFHYRWLYWNCEVVNVSNDDTVLENKRDVSPFEIQ